MATPVFYQTMNNVGVDPTIYYTWTVSITPETPAPPFLVGTQAVGSDGSQFVFVQASTSISLTDFVLIGQGSQAAPYQANSITTTNIASSLAVGLGSSGLVLKQSVTFIPAGAYFWCLTRGQNVPATTSGGSANIMATNAGGVVLFTSATAGVLTSVTTGASLAYGLVGIICVNSLTVSIPASIVPAAGGTQSNGFTVGPVVNMNMPRPTILGGASLGAGINSLAVYSF